MQRGRKEQNMTLGQKIKQARIVKGLTQKELVGNHITRNMLSKIENDSATPSVRTLEYLAGRLGLSASYLMSDLTLSDGTSPDGLDEMRSAYREGRFDDCISLLENSHTSGTTDEGYLLRALADLSAARNAINNMDYQKAKEYADSADYYNKQGLYYSAEIDAEMSLILAECANVLAPEEFEENANEFRRAVNSISFADRFELAKAENLCCAGDAAAAEKILAGIPESSDKSLAAKKLYLNGVVAMLKKDWENAKMLLLSAEEAGLKTSALYSSLETCFKELEDYKMAYHYAVIQNKNK